MFNLVGGGGVCLQAQHMQIRSPPHTTKPFVTNRQCPRGVGEYLQAMMHDSAKYKVNTVLSQPYRLGRKFFNMVHLAMMIRPISGVNGATNDLTDVLNLSYHCDSLSDYIRIEVEVIF